MHRCLTGKTPIPSVDRQASLKSGHEDPYVPLARQQGQKPASFLRQSVDWMLTLDAEKRPRSVEQVLDVWEGRKKADKPAAAGFIYVPRKIVRSYKILIAGPVGVGKTTAITTLSDSGVLTTEQRASDLVGNRKTQTTVAMDYGTLTLADNELVHIYGIPGQERFDFMWEILQQGAIGMLLLVDNSRINPLEDLKFFLKSFAGFIENNVVVIGVNHYDTHPHPSLHDYHALLRNKYRGDFRYPPPVMEVDPRSRKDLEIMVMSLLCLIDPRMESEHE